MSQFKNVLVFDALAGRGYSSWFLEAISSKPFLIEVICNKNVDTVDSTIWKEKWQFYSHIRSYYKHTPEDIRLPNSAKIAGSLNVLDLTTYCRVIHSAGKQIVHREMVSEYYNNVTWAKHHGLPNRTIVLEGEKKLTKYYQHQIKALYGLSAQDLLLCANLSEQDTVFAALTELTQYFEHQL